MQLNRSHSMHNQAPAPVPILSRAPKQPAQRSLSDMSPYYLASHQQESLPTRSPPGLTTPSHKPMSSQSQSQIILAQLPQPPCVALQRRDSTKSEGSIQSMESATRYKTEMCRPFEETGHCRYGSKCQFAHGIGEMRGLNRHPRYKTEFCRTFHTSGFCSYGQRCNFIHNEDERRGPPQQAVGNGRPQGLQLNKHMPLTVTNSSGSSPASSVYGDMSPTHSPNYTLEDPFTSTTCSRLSPAPSLSSFTSDISSSMSFPSPPGTPRDLEDFSNETKTLSSPLDLTLSSLLNNMALRQ